VNRKQHTDQRQGRAKRRRRAFADEFTVGTPGKATDEQIVAALLRAPVVATDLPSA